MKNSTVLLMMICIGFLSCNNPSSHKNSETSNLPDTTGYFAAKNMKGLASFQIGESTYSEILNRVNEEIKKDSRKFKDN